MTGFCSHLSDLPIVPSTAAFALIVWPSLTITSPVTLATISIMPPATPRYPTSSAASPGATSSPHPPFSAVPPAFQRCAPAISEAFQPVP